MTDERDTPEQPTHEESNPEASPSEDVPNAGTDSKQSRKREREVSVEPGTPQASSTDAEAAHHDAKDRRAPAKKNRVSAQLDAPAEDEEAGEAPAEGVSGSPPHETKIRQISQGVEDLTWKNMAKQPTPEPSQQEDPNANPDEDQDEEKPMDAEATGPARDAQLGQQEVVLPPIGANPPVALDDAGVDEHAGEADPAEVPPEAQQEDVQVEDAQAEEPAPADAVPEDDKEEEAPCTPPQREDSPIIVSPLPDPATVSRRGSDSSVEDKVLKRKLADRTISESAPTADATDESETKKPATASKRPRDDPDKDENPRLTKRPTPPPDEEKKAEPSTSSKTSHKPTEAAPAPKAGGFAAYASTSSPFATVKGPSLFANKSSPWASTSTSTFPSASSSPSPKPSNGALVAPSALFNSTLNSTFASPAPSPSAAAAPGPARDGGLKRTGFEAFASASSPFASAAKRSKSPAPAPAFGAAPAHGHAHGHGQGHHRSKSPLQRGNVNVSAFSAYATGGAHAFATPARRAGSAVPAEGGEASAGGSTSAGSEDEGSRERREREKGKEEGEESFSARLRAQKDEEGSGGEEKKPKLKAQETYTGEEDEDTVYQVRGKLFTLSEEKIWKEKGTGQLKLNVRREDGGGARLLMRKEAVYTVLLNVLLFKGMRCAIAADPRYIRFSVLEDGVATHYNLRVSNSKIADELLTEINAHIPGENE